MKIYRTARGLRLPKVVVRDDCPLLIHHNTQDVIGRVDEATIDAEGNWSLAITLAKDRTDLADLLTKETLQPAWRTSPEGDIEIMEFSLILDIDKIILGEAVLAALKEGSNE